MNLFSKFKKQKLDENEKLFLELVSQKSCTTLYLRDHGVKRPLGTYYSLVTKGYKDLGRWTDTEGNNNFEWRNK